MRNMSSDGKPRDTGEAARVPTEIDETQIFDQLGESWRDRAGVHRNNNCGYSGGTTAASERTSTPRRLPT